MSLTARMPEKKDFPIPPQGNHLAICYLVCDLGMQERYHNGQVNLIHKVRISFELTNCLMEDGRPFSVSKNYTLSLYDSSILRQDLESWRARKFTEEELLGFDLFKILNKPCLVSVLHNTTDQGKTFANISTISSVPQGMEIPGLSNTLVFFSLESSSQGDFDLLPEWLQKKINITGTGITIGSPAPQNNQRQMGQIAPINHQANNNQPSIDPNGGHYGHNQHPYVNESHQDMPRNPMDDFDDDIPF